MVGRHSGFRKLQISVHLDIAVRASSEFDQILPLVESVRVALELQTRPKHVVPHQLDGSRRQVRSQPYHFEEKPLHYIFLGLLWIKFRNFRLLLLCGQFSLQALSLNIQVIIVELIKLLDLWVKSLLRVTVF